MKCIRCSRKMFEPAITIRKGQTTYGYGPKCARLAGLIDAIAQAQPKTPVAGRSDPDQMPLELEITP